MASFCNFASNYISLITQDYMKSPLSRMLHIAAIIVVLITFATITPLQAEAKDYVVVIDAGHGGKDAGAVGKSSYEKNINLSIALLLGKELQTRYKDVKVVYTRSTDVFIGLNARMNKAKESKADLFISLHCNSAAKENPRRNSLSGTSVYVLGVDNANDNIELAMQENSAILLEDDYTTTYKGFDNSPEYYIFTEITQSKMMGKSNAVANEIQRQLVNHAGLVDKKVNESSRFWLLMHSTMPAVLVEMDYICNPTREAFLNSKNGQKKIAEAIANGIENYRKSLGHKIEKQDGKTDAENKSDNSSEAVTTPIGKTVYKIQILTSATRLPEGSSSFKGLRPVDYYKDGGAYKYTYGEFSTMEAATAELKKIRKSFSDAFVIKMLNGKRVK